MCTCISSFIDERASENIPKFWKTSGFGIEDNSYNFLKHIGSLLKGVKLRISFSRNMIAQIKTRALRKGVWYSALTTGERAYVDLVTKVVEKVRSGLLAKVLSSIITKLEEAMGSPVHRLIQMVGGEFALKLSQIAQTWGHRSAECWAEDAGFKQYLVITYLNAPS